ncbi:hypothetical protein LWM68_28725 [Niabella sp. W65]|nr:hypothetical protein [Niabella sp. W65]MCH7366404.1 hypothetical protein [Niabella sp. W65]
MPPTVHLLLDNPGSMFYDNEPLSNALAAVYVLRQNPPDAAIQRNVGNASVLTVVKVYFNLDVSFKPFI